MGFAHRGGTIHLRPSSGMDILKDADYKDTLNLYFFFATLPGKNPMYRILVIFFSIVFLSLATFCQLARLLSMDIEMPLVVEMLPHTIMILFCLLFIPVMHSGRHDRGFLLSLMQDDWNEHWSEEECRIKKGFVKNKLFKYHKAITYVLIFGFLSSGFTPTISELFTTFNETRHVKLIFHGNFFLDEQKYFYYIYVFQCIVYMIIAIFLNGTEGIALLTIHHICGMFAVIGHRLENLSRADQDVSPDNKADCARTLTRAVESCIVHHARALRLVLVIESIVDIPLFILLAGTVIDLTFLLLAISDLQSVDVKSLSLSFGIIMHFFVVNYTGQKLIEESLTLSQKAYNAKWYECPVRLQKLFIIILMRCNKPCEIISRKIYTLSLTNFMSVMETTVSYFMVLRKSQ